MEFGKDYFLEKLSDPFWFQSLGCVLGFDWHSSGLTTTVCGALKEAFHDLKDFGVYICGGKGSTSKRTPQEIEEASIRLAKDPQNLIYASKIVAKVDNNALQDGFNLYHHTFIFTSLERKPLRDEETNKFERSAPQTGLALDKKPGSDPLTVFTKEFRWVVIQQGMSKAGNWARRYHWHSKDLISFVNEPHKGIATDKSFLTLNMVDKNKDKLRNLVSELSARTPNNNLNDIVNLKENIEKLPSRHRILIEDINPKYLDKILLKTYEQKPKDFESLLFLKGIGAKTIRALALISDLIYGEKISFYDPARFSFAHGGKDGFPYKIRLDQYQSSIEALNKVINKAKIGHTDKIKALKRLHKFYFKKN